MSESTNTPPAPEPLQWITLRSVKTGRASSLAIGGRKHNDALTITGNLEHNDQIVPASPQDASRLIRWLQEWKEKH
jgi:hypothetical protein